MNIESTPFHGPFDGFNIADQICYRKDINSDAHKFLEESNTIFKQINSREINYKELAVRLDTLKDIFLKCTKENIPESEVSLEEKINLKYAFRDILDQVNLLMHYNATIRNSLQKGPTGFVPIDSQITLALYVGNLAFKALMYASDIILPDPSNQYTYEPRATEEDVIKRVQNALASIDRDQRFDRYEDRLEEKKKKLLKVSLGTQMEESVGQIKETMTNIAESTRNFFSGWLFSNASSTEEIKKSSEEIEINPEKERSISVINRCIELKSEMEHEHRLKSRNLSITPPRHDWNGFFDPILNNVYDALLDCERVLIVKTLQPYTPQAIFQGKSLAQLLTSTIDSETSKINKLLNELATTIGESIVQDIRKRLANNLKLITEDYNLARLTINMNTHVAKLFSTIDQLPPHSTQDDLIKALGITDDRFPGPSLTTENYFEIAHEDIISNICKLCFIESKESDETFAGFISSGLTSVSNAALEKTTAAVIEKVFDVEDLKNLLAPVPPWFTHEKSSPGWGGGEKVNKHMHVILLFLADKFVSEMAAIASEARKAERKKLPTDVSGIADEKATEEIKKSTLEVVKALRNLTVPTAEEYDKMIKEESITSILYGGLTNHLAFSFIDYAINVQGEGHVKDIMTPLYTEFIKKWTAWISE